MNGGVAKAIAGLGGAVLVGALGSAAWEIAVKPLFLVIYGGLLKISFFGLESIRDGMYRDIARGQLERSSVEIYSALIGILSGSVIYLVFSYYSLRRRLRLAPQSSSTPRILSQPHLSPILAPALCLLAVFLFLNFARAFYVVSAEATLRQFQAIVAPYVDDQQRRLLAARAASLGNRQDYLDLIQSLESIASQNSLKLPTILVL